MLIFVGYYQVASLFFEFFTIIVLSFQPNQPIHLPSPSQPPTYRLSISSSDHKLVCEHLVTKKATMQLLKSLKLVHYEHPTHRNPRLHRRHKLLTKLAEQIQLAQDSSHQPTKT